MRAAAAASGRAQGLESVEREAVHLAVEAHVRHVPVAAAVELLDSLRWDLGHSLVVEDQPRRLQPRVLEAAATCARGCNHMC